MIARIRQWFSAEKYLRERAVLACVEEALDALELRNENGIHAARAKLYEARNYLLK